MVISGKGIWAGERKWWLTLIMNILVLFDFLKVWASNTFVATQI